MEEENMQNISEINLKNLFKILIKRKVAFLTIFFIIFGIGLTFTFLVSPEYRSSAQISLSDNEVFYNNEIYKYFPAEADSLWIIPSTEDTVRVDYIVGKLDPIYSELKSDVILNNAINALNGKVTKTQLIKSINISVDRWIGIVTIENYARTPDLAYNMNKTVLDSYVNKKQIELGIAYNTLLEKLDLEIELTKNEIADLESASKKEAINIQLNSELDEALEKYNVLSTTRQNMADNKNIFTDRIKLVKSPELIDVKNTSSYLRNILFSLISAIVLGIIATFTVNYFKNPKN